MMARCASFERPRRPTDRPGQKSGSARAVRYTSHDSYTYTLTTLLHYKRWRRRSRVQDVSREKVLHIGYAAVSQSFFTRARSEKLTTRIDIDKRANMMIHGKVL